MYMKIALAHDSFTQAGGAERVVEALHELYPQAPVFTLVFDPKFRFKYKDWDIRTSGLQTLFLSLGKFQYLLPLIPWGVDNLDFSGYDLVISSSSGFIKNIRVPKNCVHINYCHTPTRFLWSNPDYIKQEVPVILRPAAGILLKKLEAWDFRGAQRVGKFIANSKEVQSRIKKYYNRDSEIIYPFVDVNFWHTTSANVIARSASDEAISNQEKIASAALAMTHKQDYFLLAGRLQAHKKNDLIVEIFSALGGSASGGNESKINLHIAGTGRQEAYLKSIAKANITFLGQVTDEQLRDEYSGARAYIYPQLEDFGLMPLEAAACGTATLAFGHGGALETIVPGVTGEFFGIDDVLQSSGRVVAPFMGLSKEPDKSGNYKDQIKQLILSWNPQKYTTDNLRVQAEKFSKEKFKEQVLEFTRQNFATNNPHV